MSVISFEPLRDRIIVRVIGESKRTAGGLHVPEMALENSPYLRAEVLYVGPGWVSPSGATVPLQVKPGHVVVFFRAPSSGEQLVLPGQDDNLMIIRESHIAWIVHGLERVTGLVGIDEKPMVLA
jgi:chaperonin GroES